MGHKRTIRPNAKRLSALFMARDQMDWDTFAKKVKSCQKGFMGDPDEMKPGRGEFHEFPETCVCEKPFKDFAKSNDGNLLTAGKTKSTYSVENPGEKARHMSMKRKIGKDRISVGDKEDDEIFAD